LYDLFLTCHQQESTFGSLAMKADRIIQQSHTGFQKCQHI